MFGSTKNTNKNKKVLNHSGRSFISESLQVEGDIRSSGSIDVSGLINGSVYVDDMTISESGSVRGNLEVRKLEVNGHVEGKISAETVMLGKSAVVKGDILFSESLKTEEGADITGYIKKTESTSLEAAQDEFRLDSIESKESKDKEKSKKGRPKIVASN